MGWGWGCFYCLKERMKRKTRRSESRRGRGGKRKERRRKGKKEGRKDPCSEIGSSCFEIEKLSSRDRLLPNVTTANHK